MLHKKHLLLLGISLCFLDAQARIPTEAFKGVTDYFQENKEFYSPTLGIVAIESGLINNLRFYGNFTADYKDSADENNHIIHQRQYITDKSDDPV